MHVEQYWSHSFIPGIIRPEGVVFDIGVNSGGFAERVAGRCRRVIGFEPDPIWQGKWKLPANVEVYPKALAGAAGKLSFHVNNELCSSLHYAEADANTVEVEAITLQDALALEPEGLIDLIKMDIEGEELAVLLNAPADLFERVAQMTIEFHDFLDPSSLPKVKAVISRMRELGFHAFCFSWHSYGDLLFLHRRWVPMNLIQRGWLLLRYKYLRGMMRMMSRVLRTKSAAG